MLTLLIKTKIIMIMILKILRMASAVYSSIRFLYPLLGKYTIIFYTLSDEPPAVCFSLTISTDFHGFYVWLLKWIFSHFLSSWIFHIFLSSWTFHIFLTFISNFSQTTSCTASILTQRKLIFAEPLAASKHTLHQYHNHKLIQY